MLHVSALRLVHSSCEFEPMPGTSFPMGFTYPPVVSLVMIKGAVLVGLRLLEGLLKVIYDITLAILLI